MFKKTVLIVAGLIASLLILVALLSGTARSGYSQAYYYTPTPGSDGRIIYVVRENDTCISIALKNGISEQQLRELNNLVGNDCLNIRVGQQLLIGIKQEDTAIPTSPVPVEPSPTPPRGFGTLCIYLFNDTNGNALAEETEVGLAGGAISITDPLSRVNLTGSTPETGEAVCFEDVPEGDYNISVAIPEGYNPTTSMNFTLILSPGDSATVDFGAQPSSRIQPTSEEGSPPSPFLALVGLFFIAAGVGLWFYLRRLTSTQ